MMDPSYIENLEIEVRTWKWNRELFPGWHIVPDRIRRGIWLRTGFWSRLIVQSAGTIEREKQLVFLYELNWRLEIALLPMWSDIANAVENCLESVNPFPKQLELPNAVLSRSATNFDRSEPTWFVIENNWIALALGLLRYFREERRRDAFSQWVQRLKVLVATDADAMARLSYEQCLYALADMNDNEAFRVLSEWPTVTSDQLWQVRRGAILAELGQLQEGTALIREAVDQLRIGLRHTTDEIPILCREGWAILLLKALYDEKNLMTSESRDDYRGRWQQLATFGCDPWPELDILQSKCEQPAPQSRPSSTTSIGFQPGTVTRSHSIRGGNGDALFPAYQYARLVEEAPFPPSVGAMVLSKKTLGSVAKWLIPYDPLRARSIIFRTMSVELVESYFSRHRVAAIDAITIEESFDIALNAATQAHAKAAARLAGIHEAIVERSIRCLSASIEILARVSIRLSNDKLTRLWTFAIELYSAPVVRSNISLAKPLSNLFKSLILSMSKEEREQRAFEIVSLPIPDSPTFQVALSQTWPEPTSDLAEHRPIIFRSSDDERWSELVKWLLSQALSDNWQVRSRAMGRLLLLYQSGCLTPEESAKLANAYWAQVDDLTGLPKVWGFRRFVSLILPETTVGQSTTKFRQYATSTPLPPAQEGMVDPSALLIDWLSATEYDEAAANPSARRRVIDWTSEEATTFLKTIVSWWHAFKLTIEKRQSSFAYRLFDDPVPNRIELILDVLSRIIIPRAKSDPTLARSIIDLVADIEKQGMPIGAVLPAMLLLQPNVDVASRLRHALASPDVAHYRSALRGMIFWVENQDTTNATHTKPRLPPPPQDLLQELGAIVADRRQPDLGSAINTIITVLERFPSTVDDQLKRSLIIGLEYLFAETEYSAVEDRDRRIPYDEVPEYRASVGRIAVLLSTKYGVTSKIISRWIDAVTNDPLPEVRQSAELNA